MRNVPRHRRVDPQSRKTLKSQSFAWTKISTLVSAPNWITGNWEKCGTQSIITANVLMNFHIYRQFSFSCVQKYHHLALRGIIRAAHLSLTTQESVKRALLVAASLCSEMHHTIFWWFNLWSVSLSSSFLITALSFTPLPSNLKQCQYQCLRSIPDLSIETRKWFFSLLSNANKLVLFVMSLLLCSFPKLH